MDFAFIPKKIFSYFLAHPSAKVRIMVEEEGSHVHEMSSYFWREGERLQWMERSSWRPKVGDAAQIRRAGRRKTPQRGISCALD